MRRLIIGITFFIVYGSLFPFSNWAFPKEPFFYFLTHWPATIERADLVQNILAYVPFGLLIGLHASNAPAFRSRLEILGLAAMAGFVLSFSMESIQQFLPARVASLSDLTLNIAGACIGACLSITLVDATKKTKLLDHLRMKWLRSQEFTNRGVLTILIWALAQTSPWVPTFDVSQMRHGASAMFHALQDPRSITFAQAVLYFFSFNALGLVWATIALDRKAAFLIFATFCSALLLSKVLIAGRQLSPEAAIGLAGALLILPAFLSLRSRKTTSCLGVLCVAVVILISELTPGTGPDTGPFNWTPFRGQLQSLNGFQSLLELFWVGFALAYFARINTQRPQRLGMAILGALLLSAGLFALEWHQQDMPGRFADITPVLLGFAGWVAGWFGMLRRPPSADPAPRRRRASKAGSAIR